MSFGSRLRELRKNSHLSQAELASKIGVSSMAISQYELDNRFPDYETLIKICRFFNTSADYVLSISSTDTPPLKDDCFVVNCRNFNTEQIQAIKTLIKAFKNMNASEM